MNRYPLWKYVLVVAVIAAGCLYALPNLFGQDPALQISSASGGAPTADVRERISEQLSADGIRVQGQELTDDHLLLRLGSAEAQVRAADELALALGGDYTVALNLAPATPDWLQGVGGQPMYLGLDLRGGVHFLMDVDVEAVLDQTMTGYRDEFRRQLREADIRYRDASVEGTTVRLAFADEQARDAARSTLSPDYLDLGFDAGSSDDDRPLLTATLSEEKQREVRNAAVEQNMTTLRNRVNELGVAEPVIQRQGLSRIVVQLPGVQDTARAKEIIGATATLEFRMVDSANFPYRGDEDDPVPPGSERYPERGGGYVLLEREVIITGEAITDASSGIDTQNGQPQVNIRLSGSGGSVMNRTTADRVGDHMAVLFKETQIEPRRVDGEVVRRQVETEEVINIARIQEQLGSRFRISGLESSREARNLALLLRAGSLAAPMQIVEERTIGPSLGQENINQGLAAVVAGFLLVVVFMAVYYKVFGIIANAALLANLILIVAVLSLLQATLTLPGIAGIVLTVGMAVDANVLIYERIREELRGGSSTQQAIEAGYGKAFSTIADANVTTLIAAVVLFAFGSGPVKGFAVTLSIGIVSSMFTAILGTRAVVNLIYGGRRGARLAI
ncbi:protein translocase subunit SecD [Spiribacter aquaticus]|uniref:Protein translocase subunit SecD n=2 Tax=Spiribacter TaxID=1335745 RepID=A0A557RJZ0_9GAMM|nr:protein-export membrane protein SecD [Spiribacter roseus]KAF0281378.1 protein-export membrane protein SecD [Spiribacter roseus]KAF0286292.1 protein-export membrane protein SecD [Spiribacter sp. SSL99]TVO65479.1 protein translocase subunit SecD [Spiribacter aquaticus]